jgi:hypothetical protein
MMMPMVEQAIECGNPHVAALVSFVAVRVEEDRLRALHASPIDERQIHACNVVDDVLLAMAREACSSGQPCPLPERCLRALGEYAFTYRSHPDFHPAWLGWRLLQ